MSDKKKMGFFQKTKNMTDTNLLLAITMIVFFAMYIGAMIFEGKGFLKAQTFLNMLNANAALIIASCGMSIVMITGSIDISVGGVAALGVSRQEVHKIYDIIHEIDINAFIVVNEAGEITGLGFREFQQRKKKKEKKQNS